MVYIWDTNSMTNMSIQEFHHHCVYDRKRVSVMIYMGGVQAKTNGCVRDRISLQVGCLGFWHVDTKQEEERRRVEYVRFNNARNTCYYTLSVNEGSQMIFSDTLRL